MKTFYDNTFFDPCSTPITYTIGRLDNNFGLSKEEFLGTIKEAEGLWEKAAGKNLFEYSKNGSMSINLIYDERQEGTDILNKIDSSYKTGKSKYNAAKDAYDQYTDDYAILIQQRESLVVNYKQRVAAYEKEVGKWNKKSSVPASVYNQLNTEKESLNNLAQQIRGIESEVNELVNAINQTGQYLNSLANKINSDAETYNEINHSFDEEFEQGVYVSSLKFKEINIYQFDNHQKFVRVLAHEMGHALGIGHLTDQEDIMYSLNIGANSAISKNDLNALKTICSKSIFDRLFNK
ncbi:MAG: matrixin family metalloprotease [Candidatus Pacebacteria bacterium]|nr:matrixin family metalloprotease [Candidatus Paceibacterota bacterium]